ncbi:MAG TPA: type II toxin-antitoxin system HicB family antitoxin [Acidobacteriota bacterium]|nr:type II toxin-antitoxin system HicB family antitoxin [Acidobacteriota bacterium]
MFWKREPKPCVTLRITVVVEPDEDGFHAYCPGLKGLHASGASEAEALANAHQAVIAYLSSLQKHHEPIPVGPDLTVAQEGEVRSVPAWMIHQITLPWPSRNKPSTN